METLALFLPPDLVDMIYDFRFYIKDLFSTNNYRICVRALRQIDNLDITLFKHKVIIRRLLGIACSGGNEEIIKLLLKRIKTYKYRVEITTYWLEDSIFCMLTIGYEKAIIKNDQKIIKMLNRIITKDMSIIEKMHFISFCTGGYLDKINLCFKKYPDEQIDLAKSGLTGACMGGNLFVVIILLTLIPTDDKHELLKPAMYNACQYNHVHIVNYLNGHYVGNNSPLIDAQICGACRGNHSDMVETICNKYPITQLHWHNAFRHASLGGHLDMVIFIMEKQTQILRRQPRIQNMLKAVCCGSNVDILELVIKEYKKIDIILDLCQDRFYACNHANIEMIQYLQANANEVP